MKRLSRLKPKIALLAVGLFCLLCGTVEAQTREWAWEWSKVGELLEPMERQIFPGNTFTFCRVQYTFRSRRGRRFGVSGRLGELDARGRRERIRGFWATDYPEADENFSLRLSQITTLKVNRTEDGKFQHAIVSLDEKALFDYPFIYMCNVGFMELTEPEQEGLRSYLLRGGFLMADDFFGDFPWENWVYEISQVLPPEEFPMVQIPLDHELFHIVFDLNEVPQVLGVDSFYARGGMPRRRYDRYGTGARCWGIFDQRGRLMVVAIHNSDLGDGWEREGEHHEYFRTVSTPKAYPMGINIVVYAMTH